MVTMKSGAETKMWGGVVSKSDVSSHQYGTHVLKGRFLDGNPDNVNQAMPYALRSSNVRLDLWNGKAVIVSGQLASGYPIEGGPPLIDVEAIEADQAMKAQK